MRITVLLQSDYSTNILHLISFFSVILKPTKRFILLYSWRFLLWCWLRYLNNHLIPIIMYFGNNPEYDFWVELSKFSNAEYISYGRVWQHYSRCPLMWFYQGSFGDVIQTICHWHCWGLYWAYIICLFWCFFCFSLAN